LPQELEAACSKRSASRLEAICPKKTCLKDLPKTGKLFVQRFEQGFESPKKYLKKLEVI